MHVVLLITHCLQLLVQEIKRERNIILQCIRYAVQHGFLQDPDKYPPTDTEDNNAIDDDTDGEDSSSASDDGDSDEGTSDSESQ